nr:transposase [Ferrimicrobium acidiphilum]
MPRSGTSLEIPSPTFTPTASTKRSEGIIEKLCVLVVIGVDDQRGKHLLTLENGTRESTQSWREVLVDLKSRGMNEPLLAIGDGALGFWAALSEIYPETKHQRCWFHKTANILNYVPKSLRPKVKEDIHEVWKSPTRDHAKGPDD